VFAISQEPLIGSPESHSFFKVKSGIQVEDGTFFAPQSAPNRYKESPVLKSKADYILDLRGIIPPITLLKVTQQFRQMKAEEVLEIRGRDPDTRTDIFKVLPDFSYELIIMEEIEEEEASYRIRMKKKGGV
jgi:TusA-related sulfurtransferase